MTTMLQKPAIEQIFKRFLFQFSQEINLQKVKSEFKSYGNGGVIFEKSKNFGIITLNYPEKKNAFSGKMMVELHDIIENLDKEKELKGLILTGKGDTFCAGGDFQSVHVYIKQSKQKGFDMACLIADVSKKLQNLPCLSVSLVNGRAIGGGAEIALSTDLRAFSEKSGSLTFIHAKMGLMTMGGASRLKNFVERPKTLEILNSCQTIGSHEALKLGLCDKLVKDEDAINETMDWLEILSRPSTSVIDSMKKSLFNDSLEQDLTKERKLFASIWT